jgi:hypothetical protein
VTGHTPNGEDPKKLWASILETLEETMQLAFLDEARYVTEVTRDGSTLVLAVESEGAFRFLSDPANQNRILILAKRLGGIESIRVRHGG